MIPKENYSYFRPTLPGVYKMGENGSPKGEGVSFSFDADKYLNKAKKIGLILYENNRETKIEFSREGQRGSLFGIAVSKIDIKKVTYNFFADDEVIIDDYAKALCGSEKFGVVSGSSLISGKIVFDDFDWEGDATLCIPYEDLIIYGLNVRAFTAHRSSGVYHKGTFEGVADKIPYLKDLGISAVCLMPCYEFDECENIRKKSVSYKNMDEAKKHAFDEEGEAGKINFWGFTEGKYFAPKASFSYGGNPVNSFKNMVKALHKAGIEVIMQFYFPPGISLPVMIGAIRYWAYEYHVDGFRISGFNIPYGFLTEDPGLKTTKFWFDYIPGEILDKVKERPYFRHISANNGDFKNDVRKFLKSDEGLMNAFLSYQKCNPSGYAVINFVADYDGFSLCDLYSYERKHNLDNGENNSDGTEYNNSWNCGTEGPSRKKHINELRLKMIKNALSIVFLSGGTPYIFSGDEAGNSRYGNNNAYCQDNEVGYVEWKNTVFANEILDFTKKLIRIRKDNKIFRMSEEFKNIDLQRIGYPDLSYHGAEAWKPELYYNSRSVGLLFYGSYSKEMNSKSFYVGINMYWEDAKLALPKMKAGKKYVKLLDTSGSPDDRTDNEVTVKARSVVIYEVI